MKRRTIVVTLLFTAIMLVSSMTSYAAGWQKEQSGWRYEREDGSSPAGTWEQINNEWYHFDAAGYMQTGWFTENNQWYYLVPSGEMLHDTSQVIDGVSYTFGSEGAMVEELAASVSREQMDAWFYATYAIIANETDWNKGYFISQPGTFTTEAKYRLRQAWGVTDRATADETIQWLLTSGHRSSYKKLMDIYKELGVMEMSETQLVQELGASEFMFDLIAAYKRGGEGAIDAWDYCRAMQVLREAYLAGYYTETEELDQMLQIAKVLQNRFSSWDDMAESYIRGYEYWKSSKSAYESRNAKYQSLKKNRTYYQIDWNLALGKCW